MSNEEEIRTCVGIAKRDIKEATNRLEYLQSICKHNMEHIGTVFCGGSEYSVEYKCKVCGKVEFDE